MKPTVLATAVLLTAAGIASADNGSHARIVTSSNTDDNQLLVYDTAGTLIQSVATLGQGGVGGNAGGVATSGETVAVVNFGSQSVSVFSSGGAGFKLRQVVLTSSPPVSVAFGKHHLFVLGTTTVESHRIANGAVDAAADGTVVLLAADGSAAQVGVVGDRLIVTEKSGTVETIELRGGAVTGVPAAVAIPADVGITPFGFAVRGSSAYITFAGSDQVGAIKNGALTDAAATGIPGGAGQHSPCWAALVGPFLFTTNSPSHSISRLVAGGRHIALDAAVAAQTGGAPIDIATEGDLVAVLESNGGGLSHLTQFRADPDGNLLPVVTTAITSPSNGVAIVVR